jgi:CheY-like chemotaxis protein
MTPEMAFEGLLISQSADVLTTMHQILDDFSIVTDVCVRPSTVIERWNSPGIDLVVLDCQDAEIAAKIIHKASEGTKARKPTIMAIVNDVAGRQLATAAGAHLVVQKPVTLDLGTRSMKKAYSLMVRDYRRYARYGVMNAVTASVESGDQFPVTILDISEGGMGLLTKQELKIGSVLSFPVALPLGEHDIHVQARVVWKNDRGAAGVEFMNISAADSRILYRWLWSRCRFKKKRA